MLLDHTHTDFIPGYIVNLNITSSARVVNSVENETITYPTRRIFTPGAAACANSKKRHATGACSAFSPFSGVWQSAWSVTIPYAQQRTIAVPVQEAEHQRRGMQWQRKLQNPV
jgi:hypothetical protein